MQDNELSKTVLKKRPELSIYERLCNICRALKHHTWDRYYNTEEYKRIEAARLYLKVHNTFYKPWREAVDHK